MEILVFDVAATPENDRLIVSGSVNGKAVTGLGWLSWTQNYYADDEHPAELDLADDMDADKREKAIQKHRDKIASIRRPMTQDELRSYCEKLLVEAAPGFIVHDNALHVEPLLDPVPVEKTNDVETDKIEE